MDAVSSIRIGGENRVTPGAYSKTDASAAEQPALASRSTLALVTTAANGTPQTVLDFFGLEELRAAFWLDDAPGVVGVKLAAEFAMDPAQSNLGGKPQRIVVVKVNPDTGSFAQMLGPTGALIDMGSRDAGAHTNNIRVSVSSGSQGGVALLVKEGNLVTENVDNLGAQAALKLSYAGVMPQAAVNIGSGGLEVVAQTTYTGTNGTDVAAAWSEGVATIVSANANDTYQKLTVYGLNAGGTPIKEVIALNGTTPVAGALSFKYVTGAVIDGMTIGSTTVKDHTAATSMTFAATLSAHMSAGKMRISSSNNADKALPVQISGYAQDGSALVETLVLNGTSVVNGQQTFAAVLKVAVQGHLLGTLTVADHASTSLVTITTGTNPSAGFFNAKGVMIPSVFPIASALVFTPTASALFDIVVRGVSDSGAQEAERVTGTTPQTTSTVWASISQFEVGNTASTSTGTFACSVVKIPASTTVADAVSQLNGSGAFVATSYNDDRVLSDLDFVTLVDCLSPLVPSFYSQTADIIDWFNASSQLVRAARVGGASGLPLLTSSPYALSGGQSVAPVVQDWAAAFALLESQGINVLWAGSEDSAVHALATAYARRMNDKFECRVHLGLPINQTADQIDAATIAINSEFVAVSPQWVVKYDDAGVRRQYAPVAQACLEAGAACSVPVGEPLTRKYMNVLDVGNDHWDATRDSESLIRKGVSIWQKVAGKGVRVMRSITSYRRSPNVVYVEQSAMDSMIWSKQDLREYIDEVVIGQSNVDLSVDDVCKAAESRLQQQLDARGIKAFGNVTGVEQGDAILLDYDLVPVLPRNFVLITQHVGLVIQKSKQQAG